MRPSAPDDRRPMEWGNPSIETDVSDHEYTLEITEASPPAAPPDESAPMPRARSEPFSPFGTPEQQDKANPRDSFEKARRFFARTTRQASDRQQSMPTLEEGEPSLSGGNSPRARMGAFEGYRSQLGTRSAFSLDVPGLTTEQVRQGVRLSIDQMANPREPGTSREASAPPHFGIDPPMMARLVRKRKRLPMGVVVGFGVVSSVCLCVALTTLGIGLFNFSKLRSNRAAKSINDLERDLFPILENFRSTQAAINLGVTTLLNRTQG